MKNNFQDNFEHRIFRTSQKLQKRGDPALGSYNNIYNDYFNIYSDYLTNLLINLLEYDGAPKTLNVQGLEFMLRMFGYANVVAVSEKEIYTDGIGFNTPGVNVGLGSLIGGVNGENNSGLQAILDGQEPQVRTRENTQHAKLPVYVTLSNKLSYYTGQLCSDSALIRRTASTLAEIKASIIANLRMQKTPFIGFTKNGNLTSKAVYEQLMQGKPFIQVDATAYDDDIKKALSIFPAQVPNLAQTLQDSWNEAINEFLTRVGLNNVSVDKKERLVSSEGDANNEQISASLQIYISARQQQMDLLNDVLGSNIQVKLNRETIERAKELVDSQPLEEGENNGTTTETQEDL